MSDGIQPPFDCDREGCDQPAAPCVGDHALHWHLCAAHTYTVFDAEVDGDQG